MKPNSSFVGPETASETIIRLFCLFFVFHIAITGYPINVVLYSFRVWRNKRIDNRQYDKYTGPLDVVSRLDHGLIIQRVNSSTAIVRRR